MTDLLACTKKRQSVDEWGTNLRSITKETRNIRGHSFVYWIEPDNILELIEKSNNFELDQFRWSLENIYSKYVYYEKRDDDYPHLKSLSDGLDAIDTSGWGEIKKNYIGWLKETIGKHLQKMIPNDDAS